MPPRAPPTTRPRRRPASRSFRSRPRQNGGIKVIHPQVDASSPLGGGVGDRGRVGGRRGQRRDARRLRAARGRRRDHGRDAVQGPAPAGARRRSATTAPTPASRPATPTAGSTTTDRTRCRSPRATTFTTTTSRWALSYTHNWDSVCDANNDAATTPLDLQPLTSSAHCFTVGRDRRRQPPAEHRRRRAVAVVDHDAAAGRAGRRHHPAAGRVPIQPVPPGPDRQPAPGAAGARADVPAAVRGLRARRVRVPAVARLGAGDGAPLPGQLGDAGGDRRPPGQQVPGPVGAADAARPLPPSKRRQLLPRRPGLPGERPGRAVLDRRPRAVAHEQLLDRRPHGLPAAPPAGTRRPGSPRWKPT